MTGELAPAETSRIPHPASRILHTRWLGHGVPYADALALQEDLVAARLADRDGVPDTLLLLEHAPVYTIGRTPDRSSLLDPSRLPHPHFTVHRGGQATFHGPGQLVGYPVLDLARRGRDLHRYLRFLEDVIIRALAVHGIPDAGRREGLTGVWVRGRKIASLGVGVRRWVSLHGFAVNVERRSLPPFDAITPCGIAGVTMTSVETETSRVLGVEEFSRTVAKTFAEEVLRDGSAALQPTT